METKDKNGIPVQVGDTILIPAKVTDIIGEGEAAMLSAVTEFPHGTEGRVYSIPVIHGSQIVKA